MAQAIVRLLGLALLAICLAASWWLRRSVQQGPPHPATAMDFADATTAVVMFSFGSAFAIEGAGLFRPIRMPPRIFPNV